MTSASGIGSHPGQDSAAHAEAVRLVLGELELPYLPEVPGRGPGATMTGRALALLPGLGVDLQPAGWRLTGGSAAAGGVDQRRARSLLAQDLDTLEQHAQGLTGPLKVQVAGPWTLAATVERPRGDRVLADHGARRDLAQDLADGVAAHVLDVRRRVPRASVVVQVDEPALPAVLAGRVPTASGFHRHRSVDEPAAAPALESVLAAARDAGAETVVHCCAADAPVDLVLRCGAGGVAVDLETLGAAGLDGVAETVESGRRLLLGVVPSTRPATAPTEREAAARAERFLEMLGLAPSDRLTLTPACGLAGADPAWAREALGLCRAAALRL
jgi:methionine synthase II (cobalamin-independent)